MALPHAMPIGPARMPFFDHLAELRRRLTIVFVTVVTGALVGYFFADHFINFVLAPIRPRLPPGTPFVLLRSLEGMTLRFTAGLYLSLIATSPIIIWQAMAFFLPALKPNERKYVVPTFVAMVLFFLTGIVFCYAVIVPPGFGWLIAQLPAGAVLNPQMSEFFSTETLLMLGFGIGFQLPVVVFYLLLFGIVPYRSLRSNWRYVYTTLVIVAAAVTPDWSPWSMGGLAVALILLYEASLLLARIVLRKRIRERRLAEEAEEAA